MYGNGIRAYRETDVNTADPKRLVIMCYQGVIDHLKAAKKKHAEGAYEAKAKAVLKAQDFLNELRHSLDFDRGGEIARNLDGLYNYMDRRIIYAEANRTVEPLGEVIGLLEDLKEAWEEIFFGTKKTLNQSDNPVHFVPGQTEPEGDTAAYGPRLRE